MILEIGSTILNAGKIVGGLAWTAPALLFQRKRAISVFKKELQLAGLDEDIVNELTKTYKQMGDIKGWITTINK